MASKNEGKETSLTSEKEAFYPVVEAGSVINIDPEKEKRLVRKLDFFIIPVYIITYMIRYLVATLYSGDRYVAWYHP